MSVSPAPGTLLAGRYRVVQFPLLEDTTAATPPTPLEKVPPEAEPYLLLSQFVVALPRPFTQIALPETGEQLLLLDDIPVQVQDGLESGKPELLPSLTTEWRQATALEQLAWLWQLARLWEPCVQQNVAHTLLNWDYVRVEAADLRLLALQATEEAVTLAHLGACWQSLVADAQPSLRPYLTQLTKALMAGQGTSAGLVQSLIHAIAILANAQTGQMELATASDQGPTRRRNEDACYPPSGSVMRGELSHPASPLFVVVCDGVGGHQGGDVASQVAIDEVTQSLQTAIAVPDLTHDDIVAAIEQAIFAANQAICDQNNAAQRQDRARMGTTLVLALTYGARLYIGHLGDSRVYRVRSHGCRQITLDDDVAAREMRLGLSLYQEGLQHPGSGALVQALGMVNSPNLRPTVEMYPLTETSLFLLCSDGLSDRGLVDRIWAKELQPVLKGDRSVADASQRLIDLANTHNGHDNVTVGLLRIVPQLPLQTVDLSPTLVNGLTQAEVLPSATVLSPPAPSTARSQRQRRWWPVVSLGIVGAIVGSVLAVYSWQQREGEAEGDRESPPGSTTLSPTAVPPTRSRTESLPAIAVGDYLLITGNRPDGALLSISPVPPPPNFPVAASSLSLLPTPSVVKIMSRQETQDNQLWVQLQVCSVDASEVPSDRAYPTVQPGDEGWVLQTALPTLATPLLDTTPAQQGLCTN